MAVNKSKVRPLTLGGSYFSGNEVSLNYKSAPTDGEPKITIARRGIFVYRDLNLAEGDSCPGDLASRRFRFKSASRSPVKSEVKSPGRWNFDFIDGTFRHLFPPGPRSLQLPRDDARPNGVILEIMYVTVGKREY